MNRFLSALILGLSSLTFSSALMADFALEGELTATDPRGKVIKRDMPMAFKTVGDDFKFKIGKFEYKVAGQPEKYSIAVVLQENNFVWVQEFSQKPIKSFEWQLGDHKIKLYKEILKKPVKGDYILAIDDKDYFFKNRLAQITFKYNEEGIEEIVVDGMVASLGLNKAKSECSAKDTEAGDKTSTEEETDKDKETSDGCPPSDK